MRILIVEDNVEHAYLIGYYMRVKSGHSIKLVNSITEAEKHLSWCDTVLLDLNLFNSKGIDTVARMRALTQKPIIVVTSENDYELEDACRRFDISSYIRKENLLNDLDKVLGG